MQAVCCPRHGHPDSYLYNPPNKKVMFDKRNNSRGVCDALTWSAIEMSSDCNQCTCAEAYHARHQASGDQRGQANNQDDRESDPRNNNQDPARNNQKVSQEKAKQTGPRTDKVQEKQTAKSTGKNPPNTNGRPSTANPPKNRAVSQGKRNQQPETVETFDKPMHELIHPPVSPRTRELLSTHLQSNYAFTRTVTDSKMHSLYNRPPFFPYGYKSPASTIVYAQHLKTHNVVPHLCPNQPKTYQSHNGALSFAKRMKFDPEEKWRKMQLELGKKIADKKESNVDASDPNVKVIDVTTPEELQAQLAKEKEFKRNYSVEIKEAKNRKKLETENERKTKVKQFYRQKEQMLKSTMKRSMSVQDSGDATAKQALTDAELLAQPVYRNVAGSSRVGHDRHAMTCFVDLSIPGNHKALIYESISKNPIVGVPVRQEDCHIDRFRLANTQKQRQSVYGSHYLSENCDQPQVKRLRQKQLNQSLGTGTGKISNQKASQDECGRMRDLALDRTRQSVH